MLPAPAVYVIESWDLFTDESGNYSAYLANDAGNLELMRYGDGVHFTWAGARRLATAVLDQMQSDWSDKYARDRPDNTGVIGRAIS